MPLPIAATSTTGLSSAGSAALSQGIATSGNLLGSLISGGYNKKRQREAQKFAKEQSEIQYQRDISFWNKQNEYNSPLSQRQRLEEAGISPWAMYGQMDTGNAGMVNAPTVDTVKPNYITENVDLGLTNAMQTYFAVKQFRMQEKQIEQQIAGEQLKQEYQLIQNGIANFNLSKMEARWQQELIENQRKGQTHQWDKERWEQAKNEYNWKVKGFIRDAERFKHEKSLWDYDKTARQLSLEQQRQDLRKGLYEIAMYPYKYQEMGDRHKLMELETFFQENRKNVLQQTGVDNKLDNAVMKSLSNWIWMTEQSISNAIKTKRKGFNNPFTTYE